MVVRKISEAHGPKVVEVLEDLLGRAKDGEIVAFAYLAEQLSSKVPLAGVVGRYRDEPQRCVGELAVMKEKLVKYAAATRGDFVQSR